MVEFVHYQTRLGWILCHAQLGAIRAAAPPARPWRQIRREDRAYILLDDKYEFTLGGVKFEVYSTPGETYDHLTVWVLSTERHSSATNYYASFPNIYTLRGTPPRWALDYVNSLNKVLALKPDLVLPSHGKPIVSRGDHRRLTQYRDAIHNVHDEVVKE